MAICGEADRQAGRQAGRQTDGNIEIWTLNAESASLISTCYPMEAPKAVGQGQEILLLFAGTLDGQKRTA